MKGVKFCTTRFLFASKFFLIFFLYARVKCHRLNHKIPLLGPPVDWNECQCASAVAGVPLPVPSWVSEALGKGVPVDLQFSDLDRQTDRHVGRWDEDGCAKPVTMS